jgi:peptidoglycan hydrolase CwlO-like protein
MSQEFVTRAEWQASIAELEERIEKRRKTFEERLEAQMTVFMTEVRRQMTAFTAEIRESVMGGIAEARSGRADILDSNRSIAEKLVVIQAIVDRGASDMDRTKNQYDRAAEALAARVGNLEEKATRISQEAESLAHKVVVAVKDLGKQINEVKEAIVSQARDRGRS